MTLKTAFWKFLLLLIAGLAAAVILPLSLLLLSTSFGLVTYADYSERSVKEIAPVIAAAPDVAEVKLPVGCHYLLLDKNYQMIQTDLKEEDLEQAVEYATTGMTNKSVDKQYLLVTRENEFMVLQYYIGSHFTIEWMNEYLPSPEILLYLLIVINSIIVCAFLTTRFARNLKKQLEPMLQATKEVAQQNLAFEVEHSKITEFEDVLLSFSDMKNSLKTALEQQWKAEQLQKEQIAALAHDLKTPLTIIQGNADLIVETDLDEEQRRYAGYIVESSEKMQVYIKTLIDLSRAVMGYEFHGKTVDFPGYLEQMILQMESLCEIKGIHLNVLVTDIPKEIVIDGILLERAVMNVLNNALYYSPKGGTIHMNIIGTDNWVRLSISDEGTGFSQEDLHHAKEQFYMADQSRNTEMHFGLGLYITNSIMERHKGQLILENSAQTGGAQVILQLPC